MTKEKIEGAGVSYEQMITNAKELAAELTKISDKQVQILDTWMNDAWLINMERDQDIIFDEIEMLTQEISQLAGNASMEQHKQRLIGLSKMMDDSIKQWNAVNGKYEEMYMREKENVDKVILLLKGIEAYTDDHIDFNEFIDNLKVRMKILGIRERQMVADIIDRDNLEIKMQDGVSKLSDAIVAGLFKQNFTSVKEKDENMDEINFLIVVVDKIMKEYTNMKASYKSKMKEHMSEIDALLHSFDVTDDDTI